MLQKNIGFYEYWSCSRNNLALYYTEILAGAKDLNDLATSLQCDDLERLISLVDCLRGFIMTYE